MVVFSDHPTPAQPAYEVVVVDERGDRVSIRAAGQLELAASEDLARLLEAQLAAGHVFVRLDLSDVTSVDCSCAGTLQRVHEGCLASQGLLLLEGLRAGARRAL